MPFRTGSRRSALGLLFACLLSAPVYCGVTREITRTFPLRADGSFELSNVNGAVRIEGWDKDEVEIHVVKTTPDKESVLDRVCIDIDSRPDAVSVSTRYPQEEGVEVAVDYVIHVPRRVQLNR